ncbi:MAG TPA: hypothetical protein VF247_01255 [Candidatus Krumholzibacteria bacterium]
MSVIVCLLVALASPVLAQASDSKDVDVNEVWQTVVDQPRTDDAMRAQILRVLDLPASRDIARTYRLDIDDAARAVPALDGTELRDLHQRAAAVEAGLAGGDKVVISTTIIIIALLVLILILVAD